jgi:hypothetical protein
MNKRILVMAMGALLLGFGSTIAAHAQSCQNQGCQRPSSSGNPNCYTCTNLSGYFCNLSGSCPQSCTEGTCSSSGGGDPCVTDPGSAACCAENPVAQGCPNPCINDPNAPEGCGTEIICDGSTITSCSGSGGGGPGGGPGGCIDFSCFVRRTDRSLLKDVAALLPRRSSGSCQTAELPKKLLFSL